MADPLIQKALEARKNAYSPYSKFAVGAALEAQDGTVFTGCNVENASYGLTICAERVALAKAISQGVTKFKRLAVVADYPEPVPPCGMCRQALFEFAPELELILANTKGESEKTILSKLLPNAFQLKR
ncbi:MAG: cytidine deaminase [Deltaproteobacteria bacterium RIFCSPLOWO2_01_44_7]|nr:MAG: cytidine deaminase [Deltaproteobacteria bacterium RIFCSPHIGHO2_01_FULL_43_49]OGQ15122.1 MAG: cytidine deaminase [Deltaproteobacteria bacterium RIFCSPHIGHO2_02_FULL_44_53]OGQ27257.1 MAG: cytidine deaminase [Deltaproteobacteria bacterium RIFCSPHIGHO2_12_FULL_44_21]OGQ31639.1 MAG: cytidine deaminase [Deltaproteobacteria bacterium RIFCSPLOWO2_01_FULL_45_74]OGQ42839.1 MAG: cytidine deaminase [Deltaproteobacteria bacterium RIFCSPLOWO2_02_FULL_44_34]OGQ44296.1 MAG: cytidine deaminase [Deltapr